MGAVVELVIIAHGDDLAEAVGEQMVALNRRYWSDSDETCERLLAWLHSVPTRQAIADR
ncbi:MAG TPA: hypothetical protein VF062_16545 [Candidatus Limnocylindrales bacterium]